MYKSMKTTLFELKQMLNGQSYPPLSLKLYKTLKLNTDSKLMGNLVANCLV